jgi:hypothetical protein
MSSKKSVDFSALDMDAMVSDDASMDVNTASTKAAPKAIVTEGTSGDDAKNTATRKAMRAANNVGARANPRQDVLDKTRVTENHGGNTPQLIYTAQERVNQGKLDLKKALLNQINVANFKNLDSESEAREEYFATVDVDAYDQAQVDIDSLLDQHIELKYDLGKPPVDKTPTRMRNAFAGVTPSNTGSRTKFSQADLVQFVLGSVQAPARKKYLRSLIAAMATALDAHDKGDDDYIKDLVEFNKNTATATKAKTDALALASQYPVAADKSERMILRLSKSLRSKTKKK